MDRTPIGLESGNVYIAALQESLGKLYEVYEVAKEDPSVLKAYQICQCAGCRVVYLERSKIHCYSCDQVIPCPLCNTLVPYTKSWVVSGVCQDSEKERRFCSVKCVNAPEKTKMDQKESEK